jgi:hypothetical protein
MTTRHAKQASICGIPFIKMSLCRKPDNAWLTFCRSQGLGMGSAEKPPLVEAEVIRDTFVTGIGDIEILGRNARITFYADHHAIADRGAERVIVARFVVAIDSIPSGIRDIIKATRGLVSHMLSLEVSEADRAGRH